LGAHFGMHLGAHFAPHFGAHLAPHLGAHFLAPHLAFFMSLAQHLPAHFAQHFDILGAHLAASFMSWAAAGKAMVAAVRAARDASFKLVFMSDPWLVWVSRTILRG